MVDKHTNPPIHIYPSGHCPHKIGEGTWKSIISYKGSSTTLEGYIDYTDGERLKLIAILEGLKMMPEEGEIIVHVPHKYIAESFTHNKPGVKHKDLWHKVQEISKKFIHTPRWFYDKSPGIV